MPFYFNFIFNFRNYSLFTGIEFESIDQSSFQTNETIPCDSWDFDNSWYLNTISQKFNLVCDESILTRVASFTFFFGTGWVDHRLIIQKRKVGSSLANVLILGPDQVNHSINWMVLGRYFRATFVIKFTYSLWQIKWPIDF